MTLFSALTFVVTCTILFCHQSGSVHSSPPSEKSLIKAGRRPSGSEKKPASRRSLPGYGFEVAPGDFDIITLNRNVSSNSGTDELGSPKGFTQGTLDHEKRRISIGALNNTGYPLPKHGSCDSFGEIYNIEEPVHRRSGSERKSSSISHVSSEDEDDTGPSSRSSSRGRSEPKNKKKKSSSGKHK